MSCLFLARSGGSTWNKMRRPAPFTPPPRVCSGSRGMHPTGDGGARALPMSTKAHQACTGPVVPDPDSPERLSAPADLLHPCHDCWLEDAETMWEDGARKGCVVATWDIRSQIHLICS